ncbi:MAG: hypothetical protein JXB88_26580 [Spirochaetales bacterium]|nr:hypothetical protein [Spirochaetales bacterium]
MKYIMLIILPVLICMSVCAEDEAVYETIVIYATKDVMLRSGRPDVNFNGKTEALRGYGYGIKKAIKGGKITYPVLVLEENKTYIAPHNSLLIGGFNYSKLIQKVGDPIPRPMVTVIEKVVLRLFVNYSPHTLNKMGVSVCRCLTYWDEKKMTYNTIYKTIDADYFGADTARRTHFKENMVSCMDGNTMSIKSNKNWKSNEIPAANAPGFVEFDITRLFTDGIDIGVHDLGDGFLIHISDIEYATYTLKDKNGESISTGDIEVACTEWLTWDGTVPKDFTGKWQTVNNKAKGKKEYIPQLIIKLKSWPNPVYDDYLKALEEQNNEQDASELERPPGEI